MKKFALSFRMTLIFTGESSESSRLSRLKHSSLSVVSSTCNQYQSVRTSASLGNLQTASDTTSPVARSNWPEREMIKLPRALVTRTSASRGRLHTRRNAMKVRYLSMSIRRGNAASTNSGLSVASRLDPDYEVVKSAEAFYRLKYVSMYVGLFWLCVTCLVLLVINFNQLKLSCPPLSHFVDVGQVQNLSVSLGIPSSDIEEHLYWKSGWYGCQIYVSYNIVAVGYIALLILLSVITVTANYIRLRYTNTDQLVFRRTIWV